MPGPRLMFQKGSQPPSSAWQNLVAAQAQDFALIRNCPERSAFHHEDLVLDRGLAHGLRCRIDAERLARVSQVLFKCRLGKVRIVSNTLKGRTVA